MGKNLKTEDKRMKKKSMFNLMGVLCLILSLVGMFVVPKYNWAYKIAIGAGCASLIAAHNIDKK